MYTSPLTAKTAVCNWFLVVRVMKLNQRSILSFLQLKWMCSRCNYVVEIVARYARSFYYQRFCFVAFNSIRGAIYVVTYSSCDKALQ
jgi:hypothetical protein